MTATFDFDQLLGSVLRDGGPQTASPVVIEAALAQAAATGQRRPMVTALDRRAWPAPRLSLANPAGARLATVSLVALLTLALLAALIVVGSLLTPPPPPLPGAWTQTSLPGTQRDPRVDNFGMARLPDGRVLLVGGVGPDPASAELYDPATNAFAPAANQLATTPGDARSLTLNTGGVLVFGRGRSAIFDPVTEAFVPTGPTIADRVQHTTTLLADGRVLVTGGSGPGGGATLASAEVFDPRTGSWSAVGTMSKARTQHAATLLADKRVLITGGWNDTDDGPFTSAELFDPRTGDFTMAAAMSAGAGAIGGGRSAHTSTLLPDGRVLIVGGVPSGEDSSRQASAELYDPAADRFLPTGSLITGRYEHAAVALADGRVLVAGGSNDLGNPLSAEIYDPATGTFAVAASASEPHVGPMVRLADGRVLIAGGQPEIFDPGATTPIAVPAPRADRTFTEAAEPQRIRTDHTAIRLLDGRVLIVGGHTGGFIDIATPAELYDPRTGTFAPTGATATGGGRASDPRERARGFLLDDGRVVLTGGARYEWDVEVYDPASGEFRWAVSIANEGGIIKHPLTAVQLADDRIFAFGPPAGVRGDANDWGSTGIYLIDVGQRRAVRINDFKGCAGVTHAVQVADDRVLLVCYGARSWLELVDVDTGRSTVLTEVLGENAGPLLRLPDGRIAFSKGVGDVTLSVLDPVTGQVSPTDVPISPAGIPELTLLADGRVLVTGGPVATLWDPATGASSALPAPVAERFGQTATLLEDGRVLIVGGTTTPPDTGTPRPAEAELFDPAGH
jgi:hypothetical protein